jgi:hypothetical protein
MFSKWIRLGVFDDLTWGVERLWSAGLSPDGRKCFVADSGWETYIIWDLQECEIIWKDEIKEMKGVRPLSYWLEKEGGKLEINAGKETLRYSVFGFEVGEGKIFDEEKKLRLSCSIGYGNSPSLLKITDTTDEKVVAELEYESLSGDWAFASFSEDGNVIAVIEPYFITFFGRQESKSGLEV